MRYLTVLCVITTLGFGAAQNAAQSTDELTTLENLLNRVQQDVGGAIPSGAEAGAANAHARNPAQSASNGILAWRTVVVTLAFSVGGGVLSYWRRKMRLGGWR